MDIVLAAFRKEWEFFLHFLPKIVSAFLVFLVFIWIGRKLGKIITPFFSKGSFSQVHKSFFLNTFVWLFSILGLIIALNILGLEKAAVSLLAGGGITAVVLGFAFREIGENFLAGFFLAFSRPFNVGDVIQSGDFTGEVKEVELRNTHIRTNDGRDIFIPSSQIFNQPLINYTKDGLRRPSFVVGIDYGNDSMKAVKLLFDTTKNVDGVLQNPPPGVFISELTSLYVKLEVFFWLDVFKKGTDFLKIQTEVMDKCRTVLLDNGFTLSSDTTANLALAAKTPFDLVLEQKQ
jgi:small-conductance mechanosensitive channel